MSLGRLSPPFLYSFSLLSKTATSSLFVIHFTEISPSTSEKHRFLQYSSPANHDSQPYSTRHIPSFGGAWGGSPSLSILFRRALGRLSFHFSNISVHSPTCSQILKIWARFFPSKYPFFVPSLQQQLFQSTNSLLFISSLLYSLISSCCPSSDVYSLPISPDHYSFL